MFYDKNIRCLLNALINGIMVNLECNHNWQKTVRYVGTVKFSVHQYELNYFWLQIYYLHLRNRSMYWYTSTAVITIEDSMNNPIMMIVAETSNQDRSESVRQKYSHKKTIFGKVPNSESARKKLAKIWRRVKKLKKNCSKIKISFLNSLSFNSSARLKNAKMHLISIKTSNCFNPMIGGRFDDAFY